MILSLVGESNRLQHEGAEIAIALLSEPERSVILRTLWRVKSRKSGPGLGDNKRPDFQELLTGIRLAVWVQEGINEGASPKLKQRLANVLSNPASGNRFGGLCLGESTHLVDEIRLINNEELHEGWLLLSDSSGDLAFPVWPDHVGSAGTKWGQYRLVPTALSSELPHTAWTEIVRPSRQS
jgi:CRISPR-associated protein Cas5t